MENLTVKGIVRVKKKYSPKRKLCETKNNKRVLPLKVRLQTFSEKRKENDLLRK